MRLLKSPRLAFSFVLLASLSFLLTPAGRTAYSPVQEGASARIGAHEADARSMLLL